MVKVTDSWSAYHEFESSATEDPLSRGAVYTRAFGDGPRNFEPWSSDVDDTWAGIPVPNYHTTPTGGRFSSRQI
ncbi:hypothetical protein TNCV_4281791 [Trichonephila clavipes]|nr:hypothetical protein TNCV_4281791 [Trichonephila clavipes]